MKTVLFFMVFSCFLTVFGQEQILKWEVFHPVKKEWFDGGTKGSVQEKLIELGELPDPFVGQNETLFTWIENHTWKYKSVFTLTEQELNQQYILLNFPSIDTYASIYINDFLIAKTDNAFIPYRFDIKKHVKKGKNRIEVVFTPPILFHKGDTLLYYPAPNDDSKFQVAPLTRKPQYQFGWDWTMRMNTIGFMKEGIVRCTSKNQVSFVKMETQQIKDARADLKLTVELENGLNNSIRVYSSLFGDLGEHELEEGKTEMMIDMENPILWWPRGHGEAFLYSDTLCVFDSNTLQSDTVVYTFGVRISELIQNKDSLGTSYYFQINGRPIFCKGGNYIPQDVFPSRVKDSEIRRLLFDLYSSNFNIVRVWGGGYYPSDLFYSLCDSLGLMVWQDLMFACAMYPSNTNYIASVYKELEYQVPRIAAHPCVIQFNGNNEVDVAWKFWGFQAKYAISKADQQTIASDYQTLFKRVIPEVVKRESYLPYIHTSPLGHWVDEKSFPHGTQHYWGVWHGKDKLEDFDAKSGRFNAEYGFQSFPQYSTLHTFSQKQDWELNSPVMKSHQKSYVGNGMIKKHSDILFSPTKDFEDFVYFSQLTQAKAVGIAISSHRLNYPYCMGTIFWQINDCWPAPSWSSIDYYGNWKALQYQVKKDYADITILEKTKEIAKETYHLISDLPEIQTVQLNYSMFDFSGKKRINKERTIVLQPNQSVELCVECQDATNRVDNYVLEFEWIVKNDTLKRSYVHFGDKSKYKRASLSDYSIEITAIDSVSKTFVLEVKNKRVLPNLWISSLSNGVHLENNFETYLPGVHKIKGNYRGEAPTRVDFVVKYL
jgi:beta-mannosidase